MFVCARTPYYTTNYHLNRNYFIALHFVPSVQKLDNRKAALERTNAMTDERKQKWRQVLCSFFISSEDKGKEEINGELRQF